MLAAALDPPQIAAAMAEELSASSAADGGGARALRRTRGTAPGRRRARGPRLADRKSWRFGGADAEQAATEALQSRAPSFQAAADLGALAVLPLVVEGRSIGVLSLGFADARDLSDEDRAFMAAAASQCAQAVERVRLQAQTERAARRWAFLAETSSALDESQEFARRAQRLVDLIVARIADLARVELTEDGRADDGRAGRPRTRPPALAARAVDAAVAEAARERRAASRCSGRTRLRRCRSPPCRCGRGAGCSGCSRWPRSSPSDDSVPRTWRS